MDAEYLKETVGQALADGLSAVAISQPSDSVEFLGQYLLKYVALKERELQVVYSMLLFINLAKMQAVSLKQAAEEEARKVVARAAVYEEAASVKEAHLRAQSNELNALFDAFDADYSNVCFLPRLCFADPETQLDGVCRCCVRFRERPKLASS
jgi:hypothetical protein